MAKLVVPEGAKAEMLQPLVQSRCEQLGWVQPGDSGISDYIVQYMKSPRSEEAIERELQDVVGEETLPFVMWLRETIASLDQPSTATNVNNNTVTPVNNTLHDLNSTSPTTVNTMTPDQSTQTDPNNPSDVNIATHNQEIPASVSNDAPSGPAIIQMYVDFIRTATRSFTDMIHSPSGPKNMRGGRAGQSGRGNNPSNTPLNPHRINTLNPGSAGRVGRNAPRGPSTTFKGARTDQHQQQREQAFLREAGNGQMQANSSNGSPLNPMMAPMMDPNMLAFQQQYINNLTPDQQKAMLQQLMAAPPQMQGMGMMSPQFMNAGYGMPNMTQFPGQHQQHSRSLFERIGSRRGSNAQDAASTDDSMKVDKEPPDPKNSICRGNLFCTNAECLFVHQSPVAPPGTRVNMDIDCEAGAACKDRACTSKHPSPASAPNYDGPPPCRFYPYCSNPTCKFKHPEPTPCKFGAGCRNPLCTFAHNRSAGQCKYNPCTNPRCTFQHTEGQKQAPGGFKPTAQWVNPQLKSGEDHLNEMRSQEQSAAAPGPNEQSSEVPVNGPEMPA